MNITADAFRNLIYAARWLDEYNPRLEQEKIIFSQWKFDDEGAHYIGQGPRPAQPLSGEEMRVQ